jgi:hypothetical protein
MDRDAIVRARVPARAGPDREVGVARREHRGQDRVLQAVLEFG